MFRFNIWSLTEEMLYRNVVMARLLELWLPKPRVAGWRCFEVVNR